MYGQPVLIQPQDLEAPPANGRSQWAGLLALLSLAAGFLHAATIDSHRGHGVAAGLFTIVAIAQVAWAALALARPTRAVLLLGGVLNGVVVAGYVVSRTTGIGFLDGFEEVENIGFTDAAAAGLEAALVLGVFLLLVAAPSRRLWPAGRIGVAGFGVAGLSVALIAVPAAASVDSAGGHKSHDEGSSAEAAPGAEHGGEHGEGTEAAAGASAGAGAEHGGGKHANAEMSYFDSLRTATPEERAAADDLLVETKAGLWRWTDDQKTYDAGFRSINDGGTGTEHLVNWEWINDDVVLDPNKPESLVYRVEGDKKYLEAAMFMAPAGTPDDDLPDVGGPITQWHIHNNLCFSPSQMVDGAPQRVVVGLASAEGTCSTGEYLKPHAPMLHVWTVERECGPFSSLEGVGAGQAVTEAEDPDADPVCQRSTE